jgi:hypothetical protein
MCYLPFLLIGPNQHGTIKPANIVSPVTSLFESSMQKPGYQRNLYLLLSAPRQASRYIPLSAERYHDERFISRIPSQITLSLPFALGESADAAVVLSLKETV